MTSLYVEWTQSADDPSLGGDVVSYEIARDTGPNPTAVVQTVPATAATDDTKWIDYLNAGSYYYRVRAVDNLNRRSAWSNEASILVPQGGTYVTFNVVATP